MSVPRDRARTAALIAAVALIVDLLAGAGTLMGAGPAGYEQRVVGFFDSALRESRSAQRDLP